MVTCLRLWCQRYSLLKFHYHHLPFLCCHSDETKVTVKHLIDDAMFQDQILKQEPNVLIPCSLMLSHLTSITVVSLFFSAATEPLLWTLVFLRRRYFLSLSFKRFHHQALIGSSISCCNQLWFSLHDMLSSVLSTEVCGK